MAKNIFKRHDIKIKPLTSLLINKNQKTHIELIIESIDYCNNLIDQIYAKAFFTENTIDLDVLENEKQFIKQDKINNLDPQEGSETEILNYSVINEVLKNYTISIKSDPSMTVMDWWDTIDNLYDLTQQNELLTKISNHLDVNLPDSSVRNICEKVLPVIKNNNLSIRQEFSGYEKQANPTPDNNKSNIFFLYYPQKGEGDLSETPQNIILQNSPDNKIVKGPYNAPIKVHSFNGINQYASVDSFAIESRTFDIEAWIRVPQIGILNPIFCTNSRDIGLIGSIRLFVDTDDRIKVASYGATHWNKAFNTLDRIEANKWHYIRFRRQAGKPAYLRLDNYLELSDPEWSNFFVHSYGGMLAGQWHTSFSYFYGDLAAFRITYDVLRQENELLINNPPL